VPEATTKIITVLPEIESGELSEVLEAVAEHEPALTPAVKANITSALEERKRPVRQVDTSTALKKILRAQGITVSGSAHLMNRIVEVGTRPEGGWRITVDVDEEPVASYTR
jgi:hypothetical protein